MKYLIIQEADGTEFPVFCCAPQTHAELATAWRRTGPRKVVAAGFVEFRASGVAVVFGRSDSLDLGPRPDRDAALITAMHLGTVAMTGKTITSGPKSLLSHEIEISPEVREAIKRELASLAEQAARGRLHFAN